MFFLPAICLVLGIFFFVAGRRQHSQPMSGLGLCLMFAAFGTGVITFFALTALN
jgi:hypothetical protein